MKKSVYIKMVIGGVFIVASFFLLVNVSYAVVEISDGTVEGLYHLNGDSVDSSGNARNGSDTSITYDASYGNLGSGASFNGGTSKISLGDINALDGLSAYSVGGWFKTVNSDAQSQMILKGDVWDLSKGWDTGFNKAISQLTIGGNWRSSGYNATVISDNVFHHIISVYDGTTNYVYVDGVATSTAYSGAMGSNANSVYIGSNNGSNTWNGSIDEIFLMSRALTSNEIIALWNGGSGDEICITVGCGTPTSPTSTVATTTMTASNALLFELYMIIDALFFIFCMVVWIKILAHIFKV